MQKTPSTPTKTASTSNINLRCFVAMQFLWQIYALFWRTIYRPKNTVVYKKLQIWGMRLTKTDQAWPRLTKTDRDLPRLTKTDQDWPTQTKTDQECPTQYKFSQDFPSGPMDNYDPMVSVIYFHLWWSFCIYVCIDVSTHLCAGGWMCSAVSVAPLVLVEPLGQLLNCQNHLAVSWE